MINDYTFNKLHILLVGGGLTVLVAIFIVLRQFYIRIRRVCNGTIACYPIKKEAEQNREIYNELVGLQAVTDADRAYVFRFHNGMEYLPSHPAWKLTCTHEVVKPGVTYESAKLQGILVSLIPNIVSPVLTGSSTMPGIVVPECKDCPFQVQCIQQNKRVVILQTDEMSNGYCKFHLEGQNIKTSVLCGIARDGAVFGMIGLDFCGVKLTPDQVLDVTRKVCRSTDKIQFHLKFNRSPFDLPIPDRPITLKNLRWFLFMLFSSGV